MRLGRLSSKYLLPSYVVGLRQARYDLCMAKKSEPQLCKCGCGGYTSGWQDSRRPGGYISGHNARVKHPMEGKRHSEEARAKLASYTGEKGSSFKHGWSKTPTYVSWRAMRSRCRTKSNASYPSYGGRGIKVCERWQEFLNFLEDMGERPSLDHSIDRIDPDGDYEPGNCRWLIKAEQDARRRDPGGWAKKRAAGYVHSPSRPANRSPRPARANECGHPEKPHYANGMCRSCYRKDRRQARKVA